MEDLLFLILVLLCAVCLARALAAVIWSPAPRTAAPKAQAPVPAPGAVEPLAGRRVVASPGPRRSPRAARDQGFKGEGGSQALGTQGGEQSLPEAPGCQSCWLLGAAAVSSNGTKAASNPSS
jgi:hypothetical protein